jgi:cysteinyl-tRNA synthetase
MAQEGAVDPRERVEPFVTGILALRREARQDQRWQDADRMRNLLVQCGVQVNDTGDATEWELVSGPSPV